jgi:glycosidase
MVRTRASVLALVATLAVTVGVAPGWAKGKPEKSKPGKGGTVSATHSLRAPVTDENFYFVMADRFANGTTANDDGGLPRGKGEGESGFDPTGTGWYHGGDLKGLLDKIDYIEGLGTTSIWLTPSFKNKAVQVQDNSAGYHGYWITDFTQIDPHLGTNDDLRALVDAAHDRGMKVYFDIITNHTADVISYDTANGRGPYISKDEEPYRDAGGTVFDDRDFAGTGSFPELSPTVSFPYEPLLAPGEEDLKVPAWLNDVTLYHNRGDTTFVGEDSLYGDFFGLDDLFTEHPTVVQGMIDIYKTWIGDFGVDGFRIDTMKHVNDEFWQEFGPEVLAYAREQGKPEFFMFGEVFDTTKSFTSHFTTRNRMQATLDFPFQAAAQHYAAESKPAKELEQFFEDDDWYTDADSNVYQLPTFLGNHDMGRIGRFIDNANPGASQEERLARDELAHELMFLSRGNPVIYYGDEQGFVGDGGDQGARQDMFVNQVPSYLDDDLIGTDRTHAMENYNPEHPLYQAIGALSALTKEHPALRDGAHQHRHADDGAGVYAFSRIKHRSEYVVALNNAETAKTAAVPTFLAKRGARKLYGDGPAWLRTNGSRRLTVTVPPLSAVVYKLVGKLPQGHKAPGVEIVSAEPSEAARSRIEVVADVVGSAFYEVTFLARAGDGGWERIGTDDTAPYRVFDDVADLPAGTDLDYKAIVLHGSKTRTSDAFDSEVPAPKVTIEVPAEGSKVRDSVLVRAVVDPERATHVVTFERSVDGGPWEEIGSDDSSPAYVVEDDISGLGLEPGTPIAYRAILTEPDGTTVTSAVRTVQQAPAPIDTATLWYFRPAGDYLDWGLHLWGLAVNPTGGDMPGVSWGDPFDRTGIEGGWARFDIPLVDDTQAVNFIIHRPGGDDVPTTREVGGNRSFIPLDAPQVWIKQGDPTVYTSQPAP